MQPNVATSPVTPIVWLTVPFVGALRFGEHAFGVHVGALPAKKPFDWHARELEPLSV